jgi:hypothetical protein
MKHGMSEAKHPAYAPSAIESARTPHITDPSRSSKPYAVWTSSRRGYVAPNGIGCGLDERARQLGLRWQGGLQDSIVGRYPNHYTIRYEERRWRLGLHVALGGGDGGERLARIYLVAHPGDGETERVLIVGHVGRHLPDNSTG